MANERDKTQKKFFHYDVIADLAINRISPSLIFYCSQQRRNNCDLCTADINSIFL